MRPPITLNRRRALAPDELTRKYRTARHAIHQDDVDDGYGHHDHDDCWDPEHGRTADDFLVLGALEESVAFLFRRPKLGELLPGAPPPVLPGDPLPASLKARPSHPPEQLAQALSAHVQRLVDRARYQPFSLGDEVQTALLHRNGDVQGVAEQFRRIGAFPGPIVMALLFAPFWVRPLASFRAPEGDHPTVTRALIEHLFQVYPVPRALQQPWLAGGLPGLKWVSWLILIGQGANLHRAAPHFGWSISRRFTQHLSTAPPELGALEACMWSEIARAGGNRLDFERLRQNPAYTLDPTDGPIELPALHDADPLSRQQWEERRDEAERIANQRAYWHETVAWLVRWREELTDETSALILAWGMHLHIESNAWAGLPHAHFSWRGRAPADARAAAIEGRTLWETPQIELTWRARGFDWESGDDAAWTMRELTTSAALTEESAAMHHGVASCAHRCAQGFRAILSLCAGGARQITVELDPFRHRIVQARGARNRAATPEEHAVLARWLAATSPERRHDRARPATGAGAP
jgi:hypothetical protein